MADGSGVLVLGLGNPILTDDGVGVRVADAVRARLPAGAPVELREVSIGGLALMEHMVGHERVILIDAIQSEGGQPGAIRRMTLDDLREMSPTQHSASPHDASLVTALDTAGRMGFTLPSEVIIFAIEVTNVTDFGDRPTPAVAQAIPRVTRSVLDELARWGIGAAPPSSIPKRT
jgi:hydrogenase maturation protease